MDPAEWAEASGVPVPCEVKFTIEELRPVRQAAARWAILVALPAQRAEDFVIAVNEVATNAVRYGSPAARLLLRVTGGFVQAEVRDSGSWRSPATASGDGRSGGMGLALVHVVCDEVDIQTGDGGTTVVLRMNLHRQDDTGGLR